MAVSGDDEGAIGEDFDAGIGAVGPFGVVFEPHVVLTFFAVDEVIVSADPGDPVSFGGSFVAFGCVTAKGDEQPTADWIVFAGMTIAVQRAGQIAGFGPGFAFIVGENDLRIVTTTVFAKEDSQLFAIRRANDAGLADMVFGRFVNGFRGGPC